MILDEHTGSIPSEKRKEGFLKKIFIVLVKEYLDSVISSFSLSSLTQMFINKCLIQKTFSLGFGKLVSKVYRGRNRTFS